MSKPNTTEIAGTVHEIGETQTFGNNGFTKRQIVIKTAGKWEQMIPVQFLKDRTAALDKVRVGDEVTIQCDVGGREYNGRYYLELTGWRVEGADGREVTRREETRQVTGQGADLPDDDEEESIPF